MLRASYRVMLNYLALLSEVCVALIFTQNLFMVYQSDEHKMFAKAARNWYHLCT